MQNKTVLLRVTFLTINYQENDYNIIAWQT